MGSFDDRTRFMSIVLLWMGVLMFFGILLLIDFGPVFGRVEKDVWVGISGDKRELPDKTREYSYIASLALAGAGGLCMVVLSLAKKRVFDKSNLLPALMTAAIVLAVIGGVFWCFNTWRAHNPGVE